MSGESVGERPERAALWMAATLLTTALVFGGGSRGPGDLVVHLAGLPALALAIVRWRHDEASRSQRAFLYVLIAAAALMALQLLPLPSAFVVHLPERPGVLRDLDLANASLDWLPLTLDRWGTARALLALMTFTAMWSLASTLSAAAYLKLVKLATVLAIPMVLLGFAQVGAGDRLDLQAHEFQSTGSATALFANRNHFATLLAMLAPLAMVFGHRAQEQRKVPAAMAWYFALALLLLGTAMTFSRAGVLLATTCTALTGVILLAGLNQRRSEDSWTRRHSGLAITLIAAGLAVSNYAWDQIAHRFEQDPLGDRRWDYLEYGWAAIGAYMPWGSGFGSFRDVYAPFEPVTAMMNSYALHAHSDAVEVAIESGLPGIVLMLAGLVVIAIVVYRRVAMRNAPLFGTTLAIAAVVPLFHSVVDYPLRTLAVACVLALMLADVFRTASVPK